MRWVDLHTHPPQLLKFTLRPELGLHIYHPDGFNTVLSQGYFLKNSSYSGSSRQRAQSKDRGWGEELLIAQIQLQNQLTAMSSQWPPPTSTLIHSTAGHPLLGEASSHSLGKPASNHMSLWLSNSYLGDALFSILHTYLAPQGTQLWFWWPCSTPGLHCWWFPCLAELSKGPNDWQSDIRVINGLACFFLFSLQTGLQEYCVSCTNENSL